MSRKIKIFFVLLFLITLLSGSLKGISIINSVEENSFFSESIDVEFKVKKPGSNWEDESLTADVDAVLDFKIEVQTHRRYEGVGIYVTLPTVGGSNMFEYVSDSSSPKPVLPFGIWDADNSSVMWFWFKTGSSWFKEASFKAYIRKEETKDVDVKVTGVISFDPDDPLFDEAFDSVEVTGEEDGPCCFPAGTRISMADGEYKNIEDIKVGDWVLGFNPETNRRYIWQVKMLGNPVHKVISINNGLIKATIDHAFYIKKQDGEVGWGVYDVESGRKSNVIKDDLLSLREKDKLFSYNKGWIEVENISVSQDRVQTYNILSYFGRRSYYADDLLVHEEYPKNLLLSYRFHSLLEMFFPFF